MRGSRNDFSWPFEPKVSAIPNVVWALGLFLGTFLPLAHGGSAPHLPGSPGPVEVKGHAEAPPPAEPPVVRDGPASLSAASTLAADEPYSIGDPTPKEQLYLEMINRARANPSAEALLFYHTTDPAVLSSYDNSRWVVDLEEMTNQFALIAPAPPLAMNAQLLAAARQHSLDMFANVFQGHVGSDGRTLAERVSAEGYPYGRLSENVFAYAKSVWHGHAGFDVDWGPGTDGMQTPPGHRNAIHNPLHSEIGIGVVLGTKEDPAGVKPAVGPQLVTQDFGAQLSAKPFITGVVYYDINGNRFYDVGEGVGGVEVTVAESTASAVTARSGGYALPVPGDGSYTVSFAAAHLAGTNHPAVVTEGRNVKIDYRPPYSAPVVTGPIEPVAGQSNEYRFNQVGGANLYEWRHFQSRPAAVETAESTNNISVQKSGTYEVLNSEFAVSGSRSFRLAHLEPQHQFITLKQSYLLRAGASLQFQSRLGLATEDEIAQVEISTDDGLNWEVIYSQPGGTEETSFLAREISLADYAQKTARFRFRYRFDAGLYYPNPQSGLGWYIDDIQVGNAEEIMASISAQLAAGVFHFTPAGEERVGLQVRAQTGHEFLEWGPALYVQPQLGPATVRITRITPLAGIMRIEFELVSGRTPPSYAIETRSGVSSPWSGTEMTIPAGDPAETEFSVDVPLYRHQMRFYRVRPLLE